MDLERAYQVLELKPGAGIKEAVEAREDQLALWDPERLSQHPRLRSRAAARIEAIRQAYDVVMAQLGETGPRAAGPGGAKAGAPASPTGASSSLFDEVFSPKAKKGKPSFILWVLLATAALLAMAIVGYLMNDSGGRTVPEPLIPPGPADALEGERPEPVSKGTEAPAAEVRGDPGGVEVVERESVTFGSPTPRLPPPRRDGPKLVRRTEEAATGAASAGRRPIEPTDQPGEWIYRRLLAASAAARQLAEGRRPGWKFQAWELVQAEPPEYWIDLAAQGTDGSTTHFIWSVNLQDGSSSPWNEEAQQLEADSN